LLVIGLPRSGTTWTGNVLGTAEDCGKLVFEPDNEKLSAPGIVAKRRLGRFPVLEPGESAAGYRRMWSWALSGAPRSRSLDAAEKLIRRETPSELESLVLGRPSLGLRLAGLLAASPRSRHSDSLVVAKSVHACLAIDWIAEQFDVDVLVVLRHPANVLASWLELDLPDRDRRLDLLRSVRERFVRPWGLSAPDATLLERAAWQAGLFIAALEDAASRHTGWVVRTHEQLCADPEPEFRGLFGDLGLTWGKGTSALLEAGDSPGSGFSLERKAADMPDSWRRRLDKGQVETITSVLRPFPIRTWDMGNLSEDPNGSTAWLAPRKTPGRDS
jgi:hypothetical protein